MAHYGGYPQQYGDPSQQQYPSAPAPDPYSHQNPPSYGTAPTGNPADQYAPPYGSSAAQPDPYAAGYNSQQAYGSPASGYPANTSGDYAAYGAQYASAPASAPPPNYQYPSGQPYHDPYAHQQYSTGQPYHDPYSQQGYYDSAPHNGAAYGGSGYAEYDPYEDQRYASSGGYDQGRHYSDSKDDQLLAKVYEDQKYVARTKASNKSSSSSSSNNNKEKLESGPGGVERFKVTLVPWDGAEPEFDRVVQVGLDGISILELSSKKTLRTYRLDAISRWALKDKEIFTFWHKEETDQQEQTVRIMASEKTNRSLLDTLTTCCFQLCEIRGLQPDFGSGGAGSDTTNVLASQRKPAPKASDDTSSDKEADKDVEFWEDPEHEGWLMKQGEHIKTWRRRWFILKQGRMFWFKEHRVSSRSVTRGIIRLKEIMEVKQVDKARGYAPNTFELVVKGERGAASQYFTADTETEMVKWMSEIEAKMPGAANNRQQLNRAGSASHAELAEQLQKDLERLGVGRR
eukprot:CAMPEP_0118932916 /NCGR_PEP_ID=MMETSP1169-20130426/10687_1 /TAXON_ID=36882 /ORGANISM="Pyramimonas obovata, Strain CCMP722" /LENGTH=513 /DNA_ID=CAMNT_0006875621 /DNA_START=349 /DNA_END=1890 /DNA_ORIENTATION=-